MRLACRLLSPLVAPCLQPRLAEALAALQAAFPPAAAAATLPAAGASAADSDNEFPCELLSSSPACTVNWSRLNQSAGCALAYTARHNQHATSDRWQLCGMHRADYHSASDAGPGGSSVWAES